MKILILSHKHPPSLGGMENHNFQLVQGLRRRGHDLQEMIYKGEGSKWSFFWGLKKKVKTYLDQNPDTDLIYLNDGLMAAVVRWLPAYTDIPIVTTFHGLDLIFKNRVYQSALQKFNRPHCYTICVSRATKEQALLRSFSESNTVHIDNGVDLDFGSEVARVSRADLFSKFGFEQSHEDDVWLISVGRAVPRKGFSWFISRVMPELDERIRYIVVSPNNVKGFTKVLTRWLPASWARFLATLSGWTTDYAKSIQSIRDHGLENRVFFLDGLPFGDMVNLLRASDLAVMPNVRFNGDMEGFGLVILEANLCQKYVVAADLEGITSAVHNGRNGVLLEPGRADGWIREIQSIAAEKETARRLGEAASNFAKKTYSWDKMVAEYESFFLKITAQ